MTVNVLVESAVANQVVSGAEQDESVKAAASKKKTLDTINNIIQQHQNPLPLNLRHSKIKDSIYKIILNPKTESTRREIEKCRILANSDEYETYKQQKKAFLEAESKSSEPKKWTEKFVPSYTYKFDGFSESTKEVVKQLNKKYKARDREQFAKEVIKNWKSDYPDRYERFMKFKKTFVKDNGKVPYDKILDAFDSTKMRDYEFIYKLKADSKDKELTKYRKDNIPAHINYKFLKSSLTRENIRFSKKSQVYVALFVEYVAKQAAFNALYQTRTRREDRVSSKSLVISDDKEFVSKYVPLRELIKSTVAYIEAISKDSETKVKRTKKSDKEEDKEKVNKKQQQLEAREKMTNEEKIVDIISQDHYVKNQISNGCKFVLATSVSEGVTSDYYKIKYTSNYVKFIHKLMGELIYKIGRLLRTQVQSQSSRTIHVETVKLAISQVLIVSNISDRMMESLFKKLDKLADDNDKLKKKKQDDDEDDD